MQKLVWKDINLVKFEMLADQLLDYTTDIHIQQTLKSKQVKATWLCHIGTQIRQLNPTIFIQNVAQIINPLLTLVILSKLLRQVQPIQLPITYSSTKYVRKAAIGQLLNRVSQPKNTTIIVWMSSNQLPLGKTSLTSSMLSSKYTSPRLRELYCRRSTGGVPQKFCRKDLRRQSFYLDAMPSRQGLSLVSTNSSRKLTLFFFLGSLLYLSCLACYWSSVFVSIAVCFSSSSLLRQRLQSLSESKLEIQLPRERFFCNPLRMESLISLQVTSVRSGSAACKQQACGALLLTNTNEILVIVQQSTKSSKGQGQNSTLTLRRSLKTMPMARKTAQEMKYKRSLLVGVRVEQQEVEAVVAAAESFSQPIPVMKNRSTASIQKRDTVLQVQNSAREFTMKIYLQLLRNSPFYQFIRQTYVFSRSDFQMRAHSSLNSTMAATSAQKAPQSAGLSEGSSRKGEEVVLVKRNQQPDMKRRQQNSHSENVPAKLRKNRRADLRFRQPMYVLNTAWTTAATAITANEAIAPVQNPLRSDVKWMKQLSVLVELCPTTPVPPCVESRAYLGVSVGVVSLPPPNVNCRASEVKTLILSGYVQASSRKNLRMG